MTVPPVYFESSSAWRAWLEDHHATETEVWVGMWKAHTGRAVLTWEGAVREALCFGWIDGVGRRVDDERKAQRFTPRRSTTWSAKNVRMVAELEAAGAAALGLRGEGPWVPTVYGRLRVRLRGVEAAEDRVVHRWLWAGEAETRTVALEDAWLAKAAPPGDTRRYRPVGSDLLRVEVRDAWVEEAVAREVLEAAGEVVRPERRDVGLIAWALVWAPGGSAL